MNQIDSVHKKRKAEINVLVAGIEQLSDTFYLIRSLSREAKSWAQFMGDISRKNKHG